MFLFLPFLGGSRSGPVIDDFMELVRNMPTPSMNPWTIQFMKSTEKILSPSTSEQVCMPNESICVIPVL